MLLLVVVVVVQENIHCLLVTYFLCPKRDVQFKQNEFHFRHHGKDLSAAQPIASDVCATFILIKVCFSFNDAENSKFR